MARREPVSYPANVVRPGLLAQDILYDRALRDEEAALVQTLMYGATGARIAAIRRLTAIRSWDGPLWIRGFVRSDDAGIRVAAAQALVELEWTAGIPDLEEGVRAESEPAIRLNLTASLAALKAMAPAVATAGSTAP